MLGIVHRRLVHSIPRLARRRSLSHGCVARSVNRIRSFGYQVNRCELVQCRPHLAISRYLSSSPSEHVHLPKLMESIDERIRDLPMVALTPIWWSETASLLETVIAEGNGDDNGWESVMKLTASAQEFNIRLPIKFLHRLMEVAFEQKEWQHCLTLLQRNGLGKTPQASVYRLDDLGAVGNDSSDEPSLSTLSSSFFTTQSSQDDDGMVSYEMFVPNAIPSSGRDSEDVATAMQVYGRGIEACRHLGQWGLALEILQTSELLFTTKTTATRSADGVDAIHVSTVVDWRFVDCVKQALFACTAAHEWDRGILVFLRGMEVMHGLELCGDPDIVKEVAYCCGQSGQWSTSLRVLDIIFDAFLDFDQDEVSRFQADHGIRTGVRRSLCADQLV